MLDASRERGRAKGDQREARRHLQDKKKGPRDREGASEVLGPGDLGGRPCPIVEEGVNGEILGST